MDEFLLRYPEFSDVPANRIELALSDASLELSKRVWGKLYVRALCALAAHLLYLSGALSDGSDDNSGVNRLAASESAGSVSVSYLSPDLGFSDDHAGLALTKYGQEFLRLGKYVNMHILAVK